MRRKPALPWACASLCALVTGLSPGVASAQGGPDDPSAYTDPAPKPIQDARAADDVRRVLRERGADEAVTTGQVHAGVVVVPRVSRREGRRIPPSSGSGGRRVHSAESLMLAGRGLLPSRRAGLSEPTDPAAPDALALLVGVAGLAAGAGVLAVRRR